LEQPLAISYTVSQKKTFGTFSIATWRRITRFQ